MGDRLLSPLGALLLAVVTFLLGVGLPATGAINRTTGWVLVVIAVIMLAATLVWAARGPRTILGVTKDPDRPTHIEDTKVAAKGGKRVTGMDISKPTKVQNVEVNVEADERTEPSVRPPPLMSRRSATCSPKESKLRSAGPHH